MASAEENYASLRELMIKSATQNYIGEAVSQLEHALQAGFFAAKKTDDAEVILAALLHDVGHICQKDVEMMGNLGAKRHEYLGSKYLKSLGFSDRLCSLVEDHVHAKRYLTWKDKEYYNRLSEASKGTLRYQGGPMEEEEALAFEKKETFSQILLLRNCDEEAKIVDFTVPDFDSYHPMIIQHLTTASQ
eukprot:TRINITY_DN2014_c0_g1_i1.p1 TRINITY_DN2014_c0_g1~~TRINITY_DN2014_c0_g1_i1.p1  ORF type:complete len:189 (-),score=54.16 TRINITY_DN2014_c0_g1_i1:102-668(-)